MAKRLNKNLVVGLSVAGFVVMLALSVLMIHTLEQNDPAELAKLAEQYRDREEWEEAAQLYRRAWEVGTDPAYLVDAGEMALNGGAVLDALTFWQNAITQDPSLVAAREKRLDVVLRIAQLQNQVGDWIAVQEGADGLLSVDPENAQGHYAGGIAYSQLDTQAAGNAEQGLELLKRATELAPDNLEYALAYTAALLQRGQQEAGEAQLAALMERFTQPGLEAAKVRWVYGAYLARRNETEKAERQFQDAITLAGQNAEALAGAQQAYGSYIAQRWARAKSDGLPAEQTDPLLKQARELFESAMALQPESFDPYAQLARLLHGARAYEDAIQVCERRLLVGFQRNKGVDWVVKQLSTINLMLIASQSAASMAETAGSAEERDKWLTTAQRYIDDALAERADYPPALVQAGGVKWLRGDEREALKLFRNADELYAGRGHVDWALKKNLARLHLQLNEPGAAQSVLEAVLERAQQQRTADPEYWVLYAESLYRANMAEKALATVDVALQIDPSHAGALRMKVMVLQGLGRTEAAAVLSEKLDTGESTRIFFTAEDLRQQGDIDGAVRVLRDAVHADPQDVRLATGAIRGMAMLNRLDDANALAKEMLAAHPDSNDLQRLEVVTRSDVPDEERVAQLRAIIESEPDAFQRAWDLCEFHFSRKEYDASLAQARVAEQHLNARDTDMALKATKSTHRLLLTRLLLLAALLHDDATGRAAVEAAARHDVDGARGKSLAGQYHMFREEPQLAITAFTEAVALQPTDARTLTYLARCYDGANRTDDARATYLKAIQANPQEALAHKGLADIGLRTGNQALFERHLAECERLIPNDPWVRDRLVIRQEDSDPHGAITRREEIRGEDPDNRENLVRLAALYGRVNDRAKADALYAELIAAAPTDVALARQASQYYIGTDRPERSLELLNECLGQQTTQEGKGDAYLALSMHHRDLREYDKMEAVLLKGADEAPTFEVYLGVADYYVRTFRAKDALPWFDKSIEAARAAKSSKVLELLTMRIAACLQPGVRDLESARRYVDELHREFPDHVRWLFWDSEVYAAEGKINRAIQSLTEYVRQQPSDAYGLYQRANFYLAEGRLNEAIADLEAVKALPGAPFHIEARLRLADAHRRRGATEESLRELEEIVQQYPGAQQAVADLVTAYQRQGRFADAERLVTAQINRMTDRAVPYWHWLRAGVYAAQGDFNRALADHRSAAQIDNYSADSVARLLLLCTQAKRYTDGIEFYEAHTPVKEHSRALSMYAAVLAGAGRDAEAVEQFRRAGSLARQGGPENLPIVISDIQIVYPAERAVALFDTPVSDPALARTNDWILVPLLRAVGRKDDAYARVESLLRTAETDAERTDLYLDLGVMRQVDGVHDAAREAYEEAVKYGPENWRALNNLAYLLSDEMGLHAQALPYARQAATLLSDPNVLDTLGWIYVGLGDYTSAIAELSRAVRLNPNVPLTQFHLGEAYRRSGEFLRAEEILRSALETARDAGDEQTLALAEAAQARATARDQQP